jgi:hypothetical protein
MGKSVKEVKKELESSSVNDTLYTQEQVDIMAGKLPKGRVLISGADFWHFEQENVFIGTPLGTNVQDPNDGRILGYDFVDENGEQWVIGASHSVEKALNMDITENGKATKVIDAGLKMLIQWKGKKDLGNGREFNQYLVMLVE